jgi:hypothetical protein
MFTVASFGSVLGVVAFSSVANATMLARITTAGATAKTAGTATVGDRIWADVNHNGIQDPTETGINGVTVRFVQGIPDLAGGPHLRFASSPSSGSSSDRQAGSGTQELASTVSTDSPTDGTPGWYQLTGLPMGVTGKIVLDRVPDYLPGGSLVARVLTTPSAGNDRNLDSNGSQPGYGFVQVDPVVTGRSGVANASYDIGFSPAAALINQIWFDANSNGRHDPEEPGINGVGVSIFDGVTHQLLGDTHSEADPTDPTRQGVCFFDGLPADRPWQIELNNPADFAKGGPLSGLTLTTSHAPSTTDADDSDAANVGGVATVSKVSSAGNYSLNFTGDIGFRPLRKGEAQPVIKPITKPATPAALPLPTSPAAQSATISAQITVPSTAVVTKGTNGTPSSTILAESPSTVTADDGAADDVASDDDVSVSVEGSPEVSSTTVKDQNRVMHDHSLILALTSDSIVPDAVVPTTMVPNPSPSPTAITPQSGSSSQPTVPLTAGGLVALGLSGLLLARRFL